MADNELRRHKIRAELYDVLTEDPNDFAVSGNKAVSLGETPLRGVFF